MRVMETDSDLDAFIMDCERAASVSDAELRTVFSQATMRYSTVDVVDPMGEDYRDKQLALFSRIANGSYTGKEITPFDVAAAVTRPFPYVTGNPAIAGEHYGLMGFFLRQMSSLPPGSRILEFGPGWGNLTIALAKLGFKMTAVDVDPGFCDLLRARADIESAPITVIEADFFWAETVVEPFDAVVFFECFHHCPDHLRLLRALHHALKPSGRILFGGEPIVDDFPVPWGVRLDGQSIWAIRQLKHLELGFRAEYFREALQYAGWQAQTTSSKDYSYMTVWDVTRSDKSLHFQISNPKIGSSCGERRNNKLALSATEDAFGLFGPYADLSAGSVSSHCGSRPLCPHNMAAELWT